MKTIFPFTFSGGTACNPVIRGASVGSDARGSKTESADSEFAINLALICVKTNPASDSLIGNSQSVESVCRPEQSSVAGNDETGGKISTMLGFLVFHAIGIYSSVSWWLRFKRICSWCQHRLGGNPFARNVTHGMCKECCKKWRGEVKSLPKF